jgi:hypothetical protein
MMEAVRTSETSVNVVTTLRYIPEDSKLHNNETSGGEFLYWLSDFWLVKRDFVPCVGKLTLRNFNEKEYTAVTL